LNRVFPRLPISKGKAIGSKEADEHTKTKAKKGGGEWEGGRGERDWSSEFKAILSRRQINLPIVDVISMP